MPEWRPLGSQQMGLDFRSGSDPEVCESGSDSLHERLTSTDRRPRRRSRPRDASTFALRVTAEKAVVANCNRSLLGYANSDVLGISGESRIAHPPIQRQPFVSSF